MNVWAKALGNCIGLRLLGAAACLSLQEPQSVCPSARRAEQRLIAAAVGGAGRVCGRGLPGETLGLTISHFL